MNFNERFPAARRAKRRFRGIVNLAHRSPLFAVSLPINRERRRARAGVKGIIAFLFVARLGRVLRRNLSALDSNSKRQLDSMKVVKNHFVTDFLGFSDLRQVGQVTSRPSIH